MTHSRVQPLLLATALFAALGAAWWQREQTVGAARARGVAERELHASEAVLQTAKREAATAEQRLAEVTKAIEARHAGGNVVAARMDAARPLAGSALVREQTAGSLRGRPDLMVAAREAAMRRIRWRYGPLIARLGLTSTQAVQFEALLVQRDGITIGNYQLQPVDVGETQAANDALRQMLGDSGYAQLSDYTNTLPMRADVARLAANLSQVEPLSPAVAEKLIQAGAAAVQRKLDAMRQAGVATSGFFPDELLLPAARTLLTPRQLQTFSLMVEFETGRKVGGP